MHPTVALSKPRLPAEGHTSCRWPGSVQPNSALLHRYLPPYHHHHHHYHRSQSVSQSAPHRCLSNPRKQSMQNSYVSGASITIRARQTTHDLPPSRRCSDSSVQMACRASIEKQKDIQAYRQTDERASTRNVRIRIAPHCTAAHCTCFTWPKVSRSDPDATVVACDASSNLLRPC